MTATPARDGSRGGRPLRVATVITRLEGGAGAHALRGARTLDPRGYQVTVITGSGGRLVDEAAAAGLEVLTEPSLRAPIALRDDLKALGRLDSLLRDRHFDVVHTHCAKAGAVGRLAARRAGVPRIVHTYHGFPFHEFQSAVRQRAYIAIERRLGRFTDLALCVGGGVAVEAVRRRLLEPQRIRTIGVVVPEADRPASCLPQAAPGGRAEESPAARARRRARLTLGLPPGAVVIGAVGRLTYQKAPEDFLAALRALARPGVVGVWIGGGELAGRVAAPARLRRLRLAEPLRRAAHRRRGGHGLRHPGRGHGGQRGRRRSGTRGDRAAGAARPPGPHGHGPGVPPRLAGRRRAHGRERPRHGQRALPRGRAPAGTGLRVRSLWVTARHLPRFCAVARPHLDAVATYGP